METGFVFYAFDGDGVGTILESLLIESRVEDVRSFSTRVSNAVKDLEHMMQMAGCETVFSGGDNLLTFGKRISFDQLRLEFYGVRFSCGIGATTLEATLALKLAKAGGKFCFKEFSL